MANQNTIGATIRKIESDYQNGNTTLSKYVDFDLQENLNKIDSYVNSKHTSGDKDSLGRDKPFFNIVTSAINIWYRATDIDRSHIKITSNKMKDVVMAHIATIKLQEWMKKSKFGTFLNTWGRSLSKYGSSVVKFVEKDGELVSKVMNWQDIIIDSVNFEANPVVEILQLTPAELKKRKGYDQDIVDKLLSATEARETSDEQKKDTNDNYIRLYEIHGNLPLSFLTGDEEDCDTYQQQMHVISFVEGNSEGEFDDFTLVSGKEDKSPYMITHLIEEDNRSQAIGAVEYLFESQWMENHTKKAIKDHLDLASMLIFQTADPSFVGQNVISAIETGDIMIHAPNAPLTQMNNSSHDITQLQNFGAEWKALGNEITGISEAMLGAAPKSGTAWRQTEAILQENHDLFELMTENKGLHIQDMMTDFILPYLKKQLRNKDEIMGTLEDHDIKAIDSAFIKVQTEKVIRNEVKESLLRGELGVGLDVEATKEGIQKQLDEMGNQRSFVPDEIGQLEWNEYFKDMEWDIEVDVTGEAKDNQSNLTTLSTVLQTIAGNPLLLQDPNAKLIFNKILSMTGAISPLEIQSTRSAPIAPPVNPIDATIPTEPTQ